MLGEKIPIFSIYISIHNPQQMPLTAARISRAFVHHVSHSHTPASHVLSLLLFCNNKQFRNTKTLSYELIKMQTTCLLTLKTAHTSNLHKHICIHTNRYPHTHIYTPL